MPDVSILVITAVPNTKIGEVENNLPGLSGLVKKIHHDTKVSESTENTLILLIIINLRVTYLT